MKNKPLEHPLPLKPSDILKSKLVSWPEPLEELPPHSLNVNSMETKDNSMETKPIPPEGQTIVGDDGNLYNTTLSDTASPIPPVSSCGCICHQTPVHNCMMCDCRKPWKNKLISKQIHPFQDNGKGIDTCICNFKRGSSIHTISEDWEKELDWMKAKFEKYHYPGYCPVCGLNLEMLKDFIRSLLQDNSTKVTKEVLRKVEDILPYGAGFTERFYTLKDELEKK